MSLSPKNLSSIQKAGQAVHDSSVVIATAVRTQAESMVASMSTAPFSVESEQLISRFKTLSKLSQGLGAVEAQLQDLYAMAADLTNPASDVILLPSITRRKAATNAAVVDVVSKPSKPAKLAKVPNKAKKGGPKAVALTANDNKLLTYLQGALKGGDAKAITGSTLASGSGLPLGSVGVSLKKIIATGAVNQVGRGTYQIGDNASTADSLAPEPGVKSAPVNKIKPVVVKKGKAVKKVRAEVPAAKDVKAKPVKATKAAPVKKTKAPAPKKAKSAAGTAAKTVEVTAPTGEAEAAPL
jgi:hypothetical protein